MDNGSLSEFGARHPLICFSHLRWDFVYQRPQHLMTRAADQYEVIYFEEPIYQPDALPNLRRIRDKSGVLVVTPVLPEGMASTEPLRALLDQLVSEYNCNPVFWYYTPMALEFSSNLEPSLIVYDCMDELSAFKDPPPGLAAAEDQLFKRADLVFTGGFSLYDAKSKKHPCVFPFPSSVDVAHFEMARYARIDPADQAPIPYPRIGFFGVIDERMDMDLVRATVVALPDIQFVMLGPVVKISPDTLPQAPNLHWLGVKRYEELPGYLGHWNAGWMPFALNEATRFISPTKTPEFLAAGLPVASTAIRDVVRTYGQTGLVTIADENSMQTALRTLLTPRPADWSQKVAQHLSVTSWDATWAAMHQEIQRAQTVRPPQQHHLQIMAARQ
jgi:glycosyltransferase involved in cell wall biosynthesis